MAYDLYTNHCLYLVRTKVTEYITYLSEIPYRLLEPRYTCRTDAWSIQKRPAMLEKRKKRQNPPNTKPSCIGDVGMMQLASFFSTATQVALT